MALSNDIQFKIQKNSTNVFVTVDYPGTKDFILVAFNSNPENVQISKKAIKFMKENFKDREIGKLINVYFKNIKEYFKLFDSMMSQKGWQI